MSPVFITGGTGYVGKPLIESLLACGIEVHALARAESVSRLPSGVHSVVGNALDAASLPPPFHLVPPSFNVSVAHPAPVMGAYIAVRQQGEALVRATGIASTILRPWYILGPGHWWPYALVPVYAALRAIGRTRSSAERLGLVTRAQMVAALVHAVETPTPLGARVVAVPEIRAGKWGQA